MNWTAGAMVTPSVRLVRELGAGGMGSVWIADHLTLHTQVVVKFVAQALATDAATVARFSREASAAAKVKSPHVVQVFDHGIADGGVPYIVMELLEGEDLGGRLARVGTLSPRHVSEIVTQICKALSRAHQSGVVHRDIKPHNIFLCDVGSDEVFVKLLDFGIAKAGDVEGMASTRTGAALGTPYYMSPEQAIGAKTLDHRTDLWSLAVVALEAMTGRRPFEGETIGALALAIHHAPLPVPSQFDPRLPKSLDAWFLKACARDPEARFANAKEMSDALADAVGTARLPSADTSRGYATSPGVAFGAAPTLSTTMTGPTAPAPPSPDAPPVPRIPVARLPMAMTTGAPSSVPRPEETAVAPSRARGSTRWIVAGLAVAAVLGALVVFVLGRDGHAPSAPTATGSSPAPPSSSSSPGVASAAPPPTATATATATATSVPSALATQTTAPPSIKVPAVRPLAPKPTAAKSGAATPPPKPNTGSDDEILK